MSQTLEGRTMAKKKNIGAKAQQRATELQGRKAICEWTLLNRDETFGEKHGIMQDFYPREVSETEKEDARKELAGLVSKLESRSRVLENEITALQSKAVALWTKDQSNARDLGKMLLEIRALMPHGAFKEWWTREKLDQSRVSYCMRLAQGKVAEAKAQAKSSPRAKALLSITKKLRSLYDLAEAGDVQGAKDLLKEIDLEIEERFFEKPKARAASAS
jgi:hypothetical protein